MDTSTARENWNRRYSTKEYVWTSGANQYVEEYLADLEPGRAIDLGAGEGRNAVWLAGKGWTVTAVDFSSVGLEKGARLAADHGVEVQFVEADATDYEAPNAVDLVLLAYLQLEQPARRTVLTNSVKWLQPGGVVFVVAHDQSNVRDGYGGPPSPDVCYTVEETVDALTGLDIEVAIVAERVVSTDVGNQVALDTIVMARKPTPPSPAV